MTLTTDFKQARMSSIELVAFINSTRGADEVELRHDNFMPKVPKVLGEKAAPKFLGTAFYEVNGASRERQIYNFPKREAALMAMSYSYVLSAKVYDHMTELEETLNKQTKGVTETYQETAGMLLVASAVADMLRVSESARLGMVRTIVKTHAPLVLPVIPSYAIDCPTGSVGLSSLVSHSLSHLLKANDIEGSAMLWNKKLLASGFIEKQTLTGNKTYWSVTKKGLEYGKNMVCDASQKTTQPYWYDEKFNELLNSCV